jgi:hypothetical protein
MRKLLIVLALLWAGPCWNAASAAQDTSSGNFMLPHCIQLMENKNRSYFAQGFCAGTVSAIGWLGGELPPEKRFCHPDGVTRDQSARVVVKYLQSHPESLHLDFRDLAIAAFRRAWPCNE